VLLRAAITAQYIIMAGGQETVKVEGSEGAGAEQWRRKLQRWERLGEVTAMA
jgi:hypothetical protein